MKAREIKRKIKSIDNTRQITRTMEMVAAAKIVKAKERIEAARPYALKMVDLLHNVARFVSVLEHPLLEARGSVENVLIVVMTSNRGLCGAFNTNVINRAEAIMRREEGEGRKVSFAVVGKKGDQHFRFRKRDVVNSYLDFGDQPHFSDAEDIGRTVMGMYEDGTVDKVYLVFNHFVTIIEHRSSEHVLLPIRAERVSKGSPLDEEETGSQSLYIFEPEPPRELLRRLIPAYVETLVLRALLESAASEHGARRTAMKAATDNAGEMIEELTRSYNRARQTEITMQIAEIVGGAEALKGTG